MIRKLLVIIISLSVGDYVLLKLLSGTTELEWGHHFSFENELEIPIDSLKIKVGGEQTLIEADTDSLKTLEGNITVPNKGYPHHVTIIIYSDKKVMNLAADSFNCYNCDGSHQYILRKSGAEYKFLN